MLSDEIQLWSRVDVSLNDIAGDNTFNVSSNYMICMFYIKHLQLLYMLMNIKIVFFIFFFVFKLYPTHGGVGR